ncbi:MAG TPA: hypothetical protein VK639_17430 [Terriglobales bacterium]|nr:hypothetical protein [Terriglobales bacterium]
MKNCRRHGNASTPKPKSRSTPTPDVLLKEVRRNQQQWGAINFWGAVLEIGGEFLMTLFFSYQGLRHANWTPFRLPNWDFLLVAFACAGVGIFRTFMLVYRIVRRRKQATANDPLKACIETSLNEVNDDIWLQRNIFWWCLLPFTTALAVSFGYGSLRAHNPIFLAFLVLFVIPLDWAFYRLTQFTVRKVLEPRRQELQTLLASLK